MEYKGINDYELIYLIQEKDELAYNTMYKKYDFLIKKIAREYYVRNKNFGIEFDDLYQEGVLALEQALNNYNEQTSLFYTFVVLCIRREMERIIKAAKRHKHMILNDSYSLNLNLLCDEEFTLEDAIGDDTYSVDKIFMEETELKRLFNSIKYDLPVTYLPVYELKINNFSNKEISELLDISYKNVDNILRGIKDNIKRRVRI